MKVLRQMQSLELVKVAGAVMTRLNDKDRNVRKEAVMLLARLPSLELGNVAPSMLPGLQDLDREVREETVQALEQLHAEQLGAVAPRLVQMMMTDPEWGTRCGAIKVLAGCSPEELGKLVPDLLVKLEDQDREVRAAAVDVLVQSPIEALLRVMPQVVSKLEDMAVKTTMLEVLRRLPQVLRELSGGTVGHLGDAIITMLDATAWHVQGADGATQAAVLNVQVAAVNVLQELPTPELVRVVASDR